MANVGQASTESLYQQFLAYMKGSEKKDLQGSIQLQYKNLYSAIHQSNQIKKSKCISTSSHNFKTGGCKFTKIQPGIQEFQIYKKNIIKEESFFGGVDQTTIEDQILLEESSKKELQNQISNYKTMIRNQGNKIAEVKKAIRAIDLQEKQFTEVYQLSVNIMQFTDQHEIINSRNYAKMVDQQEEIVQKLKKLRVKTKKELAETENLYHLHQKEHQQKFKKLIKSYVPLQEDKQPQDRRSNKCNKSLKKFMGYVQKVLELLETRQQNFNSVKNEECTKLISKRISSEILPIEMMEWIKRVEQFQAKFCIRLESSDKILVKLFRQIKKSNQAIEKLIFQRRCLLEEYEQEMKILVDKQARMMLETSQMQEQQGQQKKSQQKKLQKIRNTSITSVKITEMANSLLLKFRYIFKLFIAINIDKRRLSDQIIKLEEILDKKGLLMGNGLSQFDYISNSSLLEDTNAYQLLEIFVHRFQGIRSQFVEEMLAVFFTDLRIALMCRKTFIMEEIQNLKQYTTTDIFIQVLKTIHDECSYSYNEKLKYFLKLLLQCFKCSIKSSTHSTSARVSETGLSNHTKQNSILGSEIYLPPGMFPKTRTLHGDMEEEFVQESVSGDRKSRLEALLKNQDKDKPEQWGKEEKKNPSAMIMKLLAIRNDTVKKFKLLDLHECEKKYVKGSFNSLSEIQYQQVETPILKRKSVKNKLTSQRVQSMRKLVESDSRKNLPQPHLNNFVR